MDKKDSQFSLSPGFLRVGLKGRTGRPGKQGKDNPARRSRAIRCRATALTVSASEAQQSGQSAHCTPPHVCKRRRWVVLVCSLFVGGFVACPSFLLLTDFRSTAFPLTGCRPNSVWSIRIREQANGLLFSQPPCQNWWVCLCLCLCPWRASIGFLLAALSGKRG